MRLIDADEAKKLYKEQCMGDCGCCSDLQDDNTCTLIDRVPTVDDAVIVTRCKDCKHSTLPSALTQRYGVPGTLTCHNRYSPCNRRNVGGEDFCSYGERREE